MKVIVTFYLKFYFLFNSGRQGSDEITLNILLRLPDKYTYF